MKLLADQAAAGAIFSHPRHQAAQQSLAQLIEQLRAARNIDDGYEVQQALLGRRLEAGNSYFACRQAAIRVRADKKPQARVPEPRQSGMDPAMPETWELERNLSERIAWQFYERPEDQAVREAWVADFTAALRQGESGAYVGFLGDEGQARVRDAYPGSTWDRLLTIKRRYDPANLFRLNQNIPAAIEDTQGQ